MKGWSGPKEQQLKTRNSYKKSFTSWKDKEKFENERTTPTIVKPKDKESSNGNFLQERRYDKGVSHDPIKEGLEEDPSKLKGHENQAWNKIIE